MYEEGIDRLSKRRKTADEKDEMEPTATFCPGIDFSGCRIFAREGVRTSCLLDRDRSQFASSSTVLFSYTSLTTAAIGSSTSQEALDAFLAFPAGEIVKWQTDNRVTGARTKIFKLQICAPSTGCQSGWLSRVQSVGIWHGMIYLHLPFLLHHLFVDNAAITGPVI